MLNLEEQIAEWRRQMLAAGIKTPVPLDELESHLRDDVEQQVQSGLNAEQAFETAVHRIGQAGALKAEFDNARIVDGSRRLRRAGIFYAAVFSFYSLMGAYGLLKHDLSFGERAWGFAALATTNLSVYVAWQMVLRFFPVITNKTAQTVVGIVGGISGVSWFAVFAWFILPHLELMPGQLTVAILWAFVPAAISPTCFLGLHKAEFRRTPS